MSRDGGEVELCDQCGESGDVRVVEYDAMVDGPGYMMSERLCADCRKPRRVIWSPSDIQRNRNRDEVDW